MSRQAGRHGENPRRKSPRESPDCPPHARQKSNLDASLVWPGLFQSFCLCDAGLLSVGWLPLGNEPRLPDPRGRRRWLIPFQFLLFRFLERDFFRLSLSLRGLRCVCLSGLGWGRGPIRHHHKHGSSFLLPPHWDLLSRCCSSYFRESSSRAPCVLAHFTLRFSPFSPHRIRPLPRPRPAADSGRAAADSAAKSRLGKAARSDSWGFAADLVGFWGIPDPVFVSQGLVHEEAVLIWRGGFSTAWPLSGRLRPASHVSNPKLLAEQLCAPRGAVWQVC